VLNLKLTTGKDLLPRVGRWEVMHPVIILLLLDPAQQ